MAEPVWMDPPPRSGQPTPRPSRRVWEPVLVPLMERPGQWARVREAANLSKAQALVSEARRATRGQSSNVIPPGRWEFAARAMEDGRGAIFARYIGPEDE